MKPAIAKAWREALRSGKYKQATGALRRNTNTGGSSFCCLGVLCNMHAEAHPKIAATQTNPGRYLDQGGYLPFQVQRWAGIKSSGAWFGESSLARANDRGASFETIADLIAKHEETL